MHRMKFLCLLWISAILLAGSVRGSAQDVIFPGEELTYRVSYLNVTLGTIKSVCEGYTTRNGERAAKVKVYIKSSPNIPFVSLNSIYESWMDTSITYSRHFTANTEIDGGKWEYDQYVLDYPARSLVMDKFRDKQKVSSKSYTIGKRYNDGSSLLFTARNLVSAKKTIRLPTLIMDDTVNTVVNFRGTKGSVEVDAVNYPVKTLYLDGVANWTGIYGLSGIFEGWFSDDAARVPIKAKMKVYVGSVTIELQSWKRGSWTPPRADS
ncbi:MAG: DUF3108 domain-containing protein [Candidatus Kapabacteria bacterium]|nr:DUF3108 domain-containing protein [Candidatus Kapabacteria bacterium]